MIPVEQLDKIWCSKLAANCDLKTVTTITSKVQKQEAEKTKQRFGQWCKAVLKSCEDEHAGDLISAVAVDAWQADNEGSEPKTTGEG